MTFTNKTILVTGGTGSFGKEFINYILKRYSSVKKIIIFSRDELKQHELMLTIENKYINKIRFFIGDVRDKNRLMQAFDGVDIVVHAAALKQVTTAEYNPFEFVNTNIIGAQNIVEASIVCNVKHVVALSTDKAASPINLYGATKLCSDKIFSAANNVVGKKKIRFSIVRYGNVFASRGSVIPLFDHYSKNFKYLPITDPNMTRFNLTLTEAIKFVIFTLNKAKGGEIFVPKIPSYRIMDLANAFGKKIKKKIIGIRPGEKLHEELISKADSYNTFEYKNYYVILPSSYNNDIFEQKYKSYKSKDKVKKDFSYTSLNNKIFLSKEKLEKVIKSYQSK
tara:strand:- start:276 stop:1286 length:1011 start_codon:yes stop_codon:yes gene_type:complete